MSEYLYGKPLRTELPTDLHRIAIGNGVDEDQNVLWPTFKTWLLGTNIDADTLNGYTFEELQTLWQTYADTKDVAINSNTSRISNLEDNQTIGYEVYSNYQDRSDGRSFLPPVGVENVSYKVADDAVDSDLNGYYRYENGAYQPDASLANGIVEEGNVDAVSGGEVYDKLIQSYQYYDLDKEVPLGSGYYRKRFSDTYNAVPAESRKIGLLLQYRTAEYQQEKIIINNAVIASGNIGLFVDGVEYIIAVTLGQTANDVAASIRSQSFTGWTTSGSDDYVLITSDDVGVKKEPYYDFGNTGLECTFRTLNKGKEEYIVNELFSGDDINDWTRINYWIEDNNEGKPIELKNWVLNSSNGFISPLGGTSEYTSYIIKVESGELYSIEDIIESDLFNSQVAYYDAQPFLNTNDNYVSNEGVGVSKVFRIPFGVNWLGFAVRRFAFNQVRVVERDNIVSFNDLESKVVNEIGNLSYNKKSADIKHVIIYGQSLSLGEETIQAITTESVKGNYMLGDAPNDIESQQFNSLINVGKEEPIVAAINSFSDLYRIGVNKHQIFLGSSCGVGGKAISELSKTGDVNDIYYTKFLKCLESAYEAARNTRKTIACDAIIYMQGESDYPAYVGGVQGDKDLYKAALLQLKNDMQGDVITTYGQSERPLFFLGQTGGVAVNQTDMGISMAQYEFAQENDDVFLLNPVYQLPDYKGLHISTNGARWFGEYIAKSLYNSLVMKRREMPLRPIQIKVTGSNEVKIWYNVKQENLPLVFDTWTVQDFTDTSTGNQNVLGYRVLRDGSGVNISKAEIENNCVVLTTEQDVSTGTVTIMYGSRGDLFSADKYYYWGGGNLRDSDRFKAKYTYWDDSADDGTLGQGITYRPKDINDNFLTGGFYPMKNWASHFYIQAGR